jgi:hypothetical protein
VVGAGALSPGLINSIELSSHFGWERRWDWLEHNGLIALACGSAPRVQKSLERVGEALKRCECRLLRFFQRKKSTLSCATTIGKWKADRPPRFGLMACKQSPTIKLPHPAVYVRCAAPVQHDGLLRYRDWPDATFDFVQALEFANSRRPSTQSSARHSLVNDQTDSWSALTSKSYHNKGGGST